MAQLFSTTALEPQQADSAGQAMVGDAGGGAGTTTAKNDKTASSEAIASGIANIERGLRN
jgi:hypothetical protein